MPTATTTDVTMPQLGESVTEGMIGAWLVNIGDHVEKYDPLVEVESDKASSELPSPMAGTLLEILVEPGTTVPVGTPLCRIGEADAATGTITQPDPDSERSSDSPTGVAVERADELALLRTRSSPVVRRMAEEFGINIAEIEGSGVGGRVTRHDLQAHIAMLSQATPDTSSPPALPVPEQPAPSLEQLGNTVFPGDTVVPVTAMRRAIAENMVHSVHSAPQATVVMEVDMTSVVTWRSDHKEAFRQHEGIDLTYLPIVIQAVTNALRDHPRLNAVWDETRIIERHEINVGVAVALEDGVVVPVIRNAERLSLTGLAHALVHLTGKARSGSLTPGDCSGGTFTVNNPGTFGSLVSTPILLPSQVGILSMEAIIKRPVVIDDMIGIRSMMNLSLSIDHRALDGLGATRFLQHIRNQLEQFHGNGDQT